MFEVNVLWLTEDRTNDRDKWVNLNIRFYWANRTRNEYDCRIAVVESCRCGLCWLLKVCVVESHRVGCLLVCGDSASRCCILKRETIGQGGTWVERKSQHVRRIKKGFYCKTDKEYWGMLLIPEAKTVICLPPDRTILGQLTRRSNYSGGFREGSVGLEPYWSMLVIGSHSAM